MSSASLRMFDEKDRAAFVENIDKHDGTFKLKYLKIHGLAWTVRQILATTGANWECVFPVDWPAEKSSTEFGVLPVLYETTSSGQTFQVPESEAIEHYLARKFRLYGKDAYDEMKVRSFASSIQTFIIFYCYRIGVNKDEGYKAVMLKRFLEEIIPTFVKVHEPHLEANGRNGYYVGSELTLADIKLPIAVDIILALTGDQHVSKEKTPAIWTVYQTVNATSSLKKWKETEVYKELAEGNKKALGV
ncbi:hypothetical protein B0O80DRAFT_273369 [Mortierella sp. GBAus27b]|nr:hypothetical protein BGX31_001792 [Mortierella sp. GBA43]KAI8358046.1 hypothetical protein B0O80DRAFT_273369 [Mortierella sp. GBAus27b]